MKVLIPRAFEIPSFAFPALLFLLLPNFQVFAQATGAIKGTVLDASNGEPLADVNILLKGTTLGAVSDNEGKFIIGNVPPDAYTLSALAVGYETVEVPNIFVRANDTVSETIRLKESSIQVGEVIVYGASFRRERITEAPAAVSTIEPGEITLNSGQGQVPKLLEMVPGIDISQNGLFDYNVNTRGFNSSLNRRLLVLLDGRDLAIV